MNPVWWLLIVFRFLTQLYQAPPVTNAGFSPHGSTFINISNTGRWGTRRLTENSLSYRQLLLRCSNSCIHAVVRCQQIGLKIRFYSLNSSLFASQNRIFILNFLSSSLRALFSVSLLVIFCNYRILEYAVNSQVLS